MKNLKQYSLRCLKELFCPQKLTFSQSAPCVENTRVKEKAEQMEMQNNVSFIFRCPFYFCVRDRYMGKCRLEIFQ